MLNFKNNLEYVSGFFYAGSALGVVFAGDLIQETKNITGIIESFAEVIKNNNNIKLDIIGDGKDINYYKHIIIFPIIRRQEIIYLIIQRDFP